MHFTRRHRLDRSRARALVVAAILAVAGAVASCASNEGTAREPDPIDTADARSNDDASVDAPTFREAGTTDAGPLPIECTSKPCAIALVTTLGADVEDRSQGFCALLDDGTVACWGANDAGQLGRGEDASTVDSANAARVVGLSHVVSLDHTCAVDDGGGVWCWGTGPFLRSDGRVTTERAPVKLDLPPATKVGVSHATACAAVSDGVVCWGSNANAQLRPLGTAEDGGLPTLVPVPAGAPVRGLAVGKATFVLRDDRTLVTWGGNPPIGRLSPIFPDPNPLDVELTGVVSVDLVYDNACATAGGTGYCWGAPLSRKSSPIDRALPEPIVTPEPIVQIATTRTYTTASEVLQRYRWCASSVSGDAYCWGLNDSGQAGDGTLEYAFDAVKVEGLPGPVAQVRTTPDTTCALLTTGKVYCWGSNYNGQLGNGEYRGRALAPVEVVLP